MKIQTIKTERISVAQDLTHYIDRFLPSLEENTVVAITSKVVSICEGRMVPKDFISKQALVEQEADKVLAWPDMVRDGIILTYKNHLLIPSAGIDESNSDGMYILYPQDPFKTAKDLVHHLRHRHHRQNLGVLITDSHTTPLRKGVTGIALAWWGFAPVKSYIGVPDLFGRPLRVTNVNIADALAVGAVFNMGEGNECTPLALLTDLPHVTFDIQDHSVEEICINPQEDLYRPLLGSALLQND